MEPADTKTRTPPVPSRPEEREVVVLTIASHPEMSRAGEVAVLDGPGPFELSRSSPDFAPVGEAWGHSIEDPYISRRPALLRPTADGGLEIEPPSGRTKLMVGGERLTKRVRVSDQGMKAGVVLEIADRVALVARHGLRPDRAANDYGLIGSSEAIAEVRSHVSKVVDLEVPVLLRGESGTGKELVARALHDFGVRSGGPWVSVNLAGLPGTIAAAELFGSVPGAFTGAVGAKRGYFRAADQGTLFLDEIGDSTLELQAMLLRALEMSEVVPLGQEKAVKVDVRLVAATDSNLEHRVGEGTFREPLLHRVAAYEIWLPALRDRIEDIGRLFVHFVRRDLKETEASARLESTDLDRAAWMPASLMGRLLRYGWPGNVRQLRNLVRQMVIENRYVEQLALGDRLERTLTAAQESGLAAEAPQEKRSTALTHEEVLARLKDADWEPAEAARKAGVSRPAFYQLMRKAGARTAASLTAEEIEQALSEMEGDIVKAARSLRVSNRGLARRIKKLDIG